MTSTKNTEVSVFLTSTLDSHVGITMDDSTQVSSRFQSALQSLQGSAMSLMESAKHSCPLIQTVLDPALAKVLTAGLARGGWLRGFPTCAYLHVSVCERHVFGVTDCLMPPHTYVVPL